MATIHPRPPSGHQGLFPDRLALPPQEPRVQAHLGRGTGWGLFKSNQQKPRKEKGLRLVTFRSKTHFSNIHGASTVCQTPGKAPGFKINTQCLFSRGFLYSGEHRSMGPQLGLSGAENEESLVYGGGGIGSSELGLEG